MSQNSGKSSDPAAERKAARLSVPAAREIVQKAIGKEGGFSERISPAFPARWPPTANSDVVYFVYTSSALPTSMNLRRVFSPYLRIEFPIVSSGAVQQEIRKLEPRQLEPPESAGAHSTSQESLDNAQAALFAAVGLPDGETAEQIRRPYLAWMHDHAALAAELKQSFPKFFAWLWEK